MEGECVISRSLVIVSSKKDVKGATSQKSVGVSQDAKTLNNVKKKDIQRTANNSLQEMVADMEKTVPIPTVLINMLKSGMSYERKFVY